MQMKLIKKMSSSALLCCFSAVWNSKNVKIIKRTLISIKAMDTTVDAPSVLVSFAKATLGKTNGDTSVAIM